MVEMFTKEDFNVFQVEGLEPRMAEIRRVIQPKFQSVDDYVVSKLAPELDEELLVHIAQHRRRTTNAPDFTWSAMGGDKRGYKKYPHFTLGITEDYLVMWLSFIDNPVNEKEMADSFLKQPSLFEGLPEGTVLNFDHTVNNYHEFNTDNLIKGLERWRDVKKGEFQIGRVLLKTETLLSQPAKALDYISETYLSLVPLYQDAIKYSVK